MTNFFRYFPLLGIPFLIYNFVALLESNGANLLRHIIFTLHLPSRAISHFRVIDVLLVSGILLLFFEIFKSTRAATASIVEHIFSLFLFLFFLLEYLVVPSFGNAAFFTLTSMAFLDVIAGFTITITAARRDLSIN